MRMETRTTATLAFLDFTQDWQHPIGHQFYKVGSRRSTHTSVRAVEKDGKRNPASTYTIQRPSDVVHQSCNLVASVRVKQFIMKGVRQFGGEFEGPNK